MRFQLQVEGIDRTWRTVAECDRLLHLGDHVKKWYQQTPAKHIRILDTQTGRFIYSKEET